MAEVYRRVAGEKIERFVARNKSVHRELRKPAMDILLKAEDNLAVVRADPAYTGDFAVRLHIKDDDFDYYIILDDDIASGGKPGAAASIEYGHYAGPRTRGNRPWVEGKWILHDAAGIERRAR